jgi:hypothetical protein
MCTTGLFISLEPRTALPHPRPQAAIPRYEAVLSGIGVAMHLAVPFSRVSPGTSLLSAISRYEAILNGIGVAMR